MPQRRQARFGERRSTGSQVKKVRPCGGKAHALLEPPAVWVPSAVEWCQ